MREGQEIFPASQALVRHAILTHGAGFLKIALGIYFFRRSAYVLIARGKTAIDELARHHVRALILAIALGPALRRSRTRLARSTARYRRWIRNASAIRVITHFTRGAIGILRAKNFAYAVETGLSGRTLGVGHALRIHRIRNAVSIGAFFARAAGLLIVAADFAFPIHAHFAGAAFEAVVAADDTETIDTQEIRGTFCRRVASARRDGRITRGFSTRTAAATAAATATPAAATTTTTGTAATAATAAFHRGICRFATILITPETVLPGRITRKLGVAARTPNISCAGQ